MYVQSMRKRAEWNNPPCPGIRLGHNQFFTSIQINASNEDVQLQGTAGGIHKDGYDDPLGFSVAYNLSALRKNLSDDRSTKLGLFFFPTMSCGVWLEHDTIIVFSGCEFHTGMPFLAGQGQLPLGFDKEWRFNVICYPKARVINGRMERNMGHTSETHASRIPVTPYNLNHHSAVAFGSPMTRRLWSIREEARIMFQRSISNLEPLFNTGRLSLGSLFNLLALEFKDPDETPWIPYRFLETWQEDGRTRAFLAKMDYYNKMMIDFTGTMILRDTSVNEPPDRKASSGIHSASLRASHVGKMARRDLQADVLKENIDEKGKSGNGTRFPAPPTVQTDQRLPIGFTNIMVERFNKNVAMAHIKRHHLHQRDTYLAEAEAAVGAKGRSISLHSLNHSPLLWFRSPCNAGNMTGLKGFAHGMEICNALENQSVRNQRKSIALKLVGIYHLLTLWYIDCYGFASRGNRHLSKDPGMDQLMHRVHAVLSRAPREDDQGYGYVVNIHDLMQDIHDPSWMEQNPTKIVHILHHEVLSAESAQKYLVDAMSIVIWKFYIEPILAPIQFKAYDSRPRRRANGPVDKILLIHPVYRDRRKMENRLQVILGVLRFFAREQEQHSNQPQTDITFGLLQVEPFLATVFDNKPRRFLNAEDICTYVDAFTIANERISNGLRKSANSWAQVYGKDEKLHLQPLEWSDVAAVGPRRDQFPTRLILNSKRSYPDIQQQESLPPSQQETSSSFVSLPSATKRVKFEPSRPSPRTKMHEIKREEEEEEEDRRGEKAMFQKGGRAKEKCFEEISSSRLDEVVTLMSQKIMLILRAGEFQSQVLFDGKSASDIQHLEPSAKRYYQTYLQRDSRYYDDKFTPCRQVGGSFQQAKRLLGEPPSEPCARRLYLHRWFAMRCFGWGKPEIMNRLATIDPDQPRLLAQISKDLTNRGFFYTSVYGQVQWNSKALGIEGRQYTAQSRIVAELHQAIDSYLTSIKDISRLPGKPMVDFETALGLLDRITRKPGCSEWIALPGVGSHTLVGWLWTCDVCQLYPDLVHEPKVNDLAIKIHNGSQGRGGGGPYLAWKGEFPEYTFKTVRQEQWCNILLKLDREVKRGLTVAILKPYGGKWGFHHLEHVLCKVRRDKSKCQRNPRSKSQ